MSIRKVPVSWQPISFVMSALMSSTRSFGSVGGINLLANLAELGTGSINPNFVERQIDAMMLEVVMDVEGQNCARGESEVD